MFKSLFGLLLFLALDILFSIWCLLEYKWLFVLVLVSSWLGVFMLRHHRLLIIRTLISQIHNGNLPRKSALPALLWTARYYVAAILFIMPGFLSDILAFLFLIPWKGKQASPIPSDHIIEAEFSYDNIDQTAYHSPLSQKSTKNHIHK